MAIATATTPRRPRLVRDSRFWVSVGVAVAAGAWWLNDLAFQWATLVEYQFGWIMVMLAGFLVWERWPTRPREDKPSPFGHCLALAGLGAPMVLVAELYKSGIAHVASSSFLLSVGAALFLASQALFWRGPATLRHFLFPLLFFFVAVPIPKSLWDPIVLGLQGMVTWIDVQVLKLAGVPVIQQRNVMRLPNCVVGVDQACSGVRSLQSSVMAALFIGDLTLKRRWLKIFFVAAGILLAIGGNLFRSLYLAVTAYKHGAAALKAVHDTAGWLVLGFTAAGLVILAVVVSRLDKHRLEGAVAAP